MSISWEDVYAWGLNFHGIGDPHWSRRHVVDAPVYGRVHATCDLDEDAQDGRCQCPGLTYPTCQQCCLKRLEGSRYCTYCSEHCEEAR